MRDVLRSAAAGASARETAGELHVSVGTVKTVRAAACARLEARNVTVAVLIAFKRGDL
jgi:DNA-binding NarL/FixJ family response regulator